MQGHFVPISSRLFVDMQLKQFESVPPSQVVQLKWHGGQVLAPS
jgi:hypothetical protein